MSSKRVLSLFPVLNKLKLFWDRITFSKITIFYFVFSVLHCLIQLVFQVQAFTVNARAANVLWTLVMKDTNDTDPGFAVMTSSGLSFCSTVPNSLSANGCQQVWSPKAENSSLSESDIQAWASSSQDSVTTVSASISSPSPSPSQELAVSLSNIISQSSITRAPPKTTTVTETVKASATSSPKSSASVTGDNNGTVDVSLQEPEGSINKVVFDKRDNSDFEAVATVSSANGTTVLSVTGLGFDNQDITLTHECLVTLNWPVETLSNTKREDITYMFFTVWVLGMSIVAILNESMPHIIASLLTHVGATAWGGFQISQTDAFRRMFNRLTTDGACRVNILNSYWEQRAQAEIPSLALNALALLISAFLSWRLVKLFGWQTFKRVGASRTINRVYKLVLILSIVIQLSLFFILASIALWIDSLYNGAIGQLSTDRKLFEITLFVVLALLIPWLTLGWVSVRRELRLPMLVFLVMSFGYLGGWGAMFKAPSFRWTFVLWRFFSVITSASVFLTLLTVVIGVWCRLNFGKGLPRYLNAQELLDDSASEWGSKDAYDDEEKVEFPSGRPLPTFSAAFGNDVPPSQMRFGPPRLGPRFNNPSLEPFDPQPPMDSGISDHLTTYSKSSVTTTNSSASHSNEPLAIAEWKDHARSASVGSQKSYSSYKSSSSQRSHNSSRSAQLYGSAVGPDRRWMIE